MAADSLWVQVIRSSPAILTLETKYVACTRPLPCLTLIHECGLKPPNGAVHGFNRKQLRLTKLFANLTFLYETGNVQVPKEDTTSLSFLCIFILFKRPSSFLWLVFFALVSASVYSLLLFVVPHLEPSYILL